MEEQYKGSGENFIKTKEACGICDKSILSAKKIDKLKKQKNNDSKPLFTHETIEAAMEKQRKASRERMNQVAQTRFGNQQPQQGEGR